MPISTEAALSPSSADPVALLDRAFRAAMIGAFGPEFADVDPLIRPSQNPQFGDFQANFAMGLSKRLSGGAGGKKPREAAQAVVDVLNISEIAEEPEVAGPGFINIRLKADTLGRFLDAMDDESLGIARDPDTHTIAIDLCGVNVAKQTHVGHLRSTIIGDALARVLERLGSTVHRENHLGDWGLPIAMVLHQLRVQKVDLDALTLDALDRAYRDAQKAAKEDEAVLEGAKQTLIKLQKGEPDVLADWHKLIDITLEAVYESFEMLSVRLGPENNRGESFYREQLPEVVDAFVRSGIGAEDEGAIVVRFPDRERPLLIRKSDGGFLYATTDLAAIRYRVQQLGADRVIYVVDARQRDHFRDVFDAARMIGWDVTPDGTKAELHHIPFGAVLGPNKKPLKTRSGENVTLRELLVEAIERGAKEVIQRAQDPKAPTHGLPEGELRAIGKAVGIGAVKYADLSTDLVKDYVFNVDRMIAFEGNTGPYLQYAHARICSIFARIGGGSEHLPNAAPGALGHVAGAEYIINEPEEKRLALMLLRYGGVVADAGRTLEPHRLCAYLYELADAYSVFYQQCPVLKAEDERLMRSRLRMCDLVRRVLADGLGLLGIDAPRRM